MRACSKRGIARAALLALMGLGCGSCSEEYLARRDTLSPGSGDAVKANVAIQAIDPWSPAARRTDASTSGARLQQAMELYRNPSTSNGPNGAIPNGGGGASGATGTGGVPVAR